MWGLTGRDNSALPNATALPSQMPHLSPGQELPFGSAQPLCRRNEFVTLNQGSRKNPQTPAMTPNLRGCPLELSASWEATIPSCQPGPCVTAHKVPWRPRGELRSWGRDWLVGFLSLRDPGRPGARGFSSALLPPAMTCWPQGRFAAVLSNSLLG